MYIVKPYTFQITRNNYKSNNESRMSTSLVIMKVGCQHFDAEPYTCNYKSVLILKQKVRFEWDIILNIKGLAHYG